MSGRSIHNILEIMKHDLKASFKNPIVVIVLVAIIILPSLYALFNIQACWDPYENTNEVEFAIANLDKGATFNNKEINVGDELIKELKKNDSFDWTFVSEEELRKGVHDGTYYAGIIIPKNLSENIISITTDNPTSAKLEYIVNIKENPVANKLTDTGANAVYNTMNAKIVEFINVAAYDKLGDLESSLASGAGEMTSGASQLSSGASEVSSGANDLSNGASKITSSASKVSTGASKVTNGASKVNSGTKQINDGAKEISNSAGKVETGSKEVQEGASQIESSIDTKTLPDGPVKQVIEGSVKLANSSGQVASGSSQLAHGSVKLANSSTTLASGASETANGAAQVADGAVKLAGGSDELAEGALSLAAGSQLLSNSAAQALITAASSLSGAANSLSGITGIDENLIGDYFYSPVKLDKHEEFPVSNYGSSVAPFYIVLSMWVGAVITCVMIKPGISSGTKYSPLEMYFGKLLLFILMSILQSLVTATGCFIIGIDINNPLMFIFSAILVSIIFMVINYSLISALGQVGKAISIIILVLQISGTGGIYPIEIMDSFFQIVYPFLPMTYAINLIRESLLGLLWINYMPSFLILLGLGITTVIIAVIIKEKADKSSHYFEERLKETGLF